MKFLNFYIIFNFFIAKNLALNDTLITGKWYQLWSNRYVQETSEIDWNCVKLEINYINNLYTFNKSAIIHNNHNINIKKNITYIWSEKDDKFYPYPYQTIVNPIVEIKIFGEISNNQYDYLVLTGKDNLSMFTIVRDIDKFNEKYIHQVSNLLFKYNYTGYYKSPLSSFTNIC